MAEGEGGGGGGEGGGEGEEKVSVEIDGNPAGLLAATALAAASMRGLTKDFEEIGKSAIGNMKDTLGAIGNVGRVAGDVGLKVLEVGKKLAELGAVGTVAFAGLSVAGVKFAGDLQESVNNISTIKPDIDTTAVFKSLNEISTRVPQTAKQLGDSLYNIFSSVDISQKDALSLVEKFAQGATGAQTSTDTWGTAVMGVMNAYGLTLKDVDHIQDDMFNTINKGVVNGNQLASALGPVVASAKMAGLSFDDLNAAIVGTTKEGGDAAQNINNLNNYLSKITTKEAQKGMNDLGVKTIDATGKFRPFNDVLGDLKTALGKMTEAQKANALQAIFPDIQARQGAIVMMSELDSINDALKTNQANTHATTDAYQKMAAGFKAQGTILKNTFIADLTAMGNGLLPAITPAFTALSGVLRDSMGSFEKLGKVMGTGLAEAISQTRDSIVTFHSALSGNWTDADQIRPLQAFFGNLGLIIHNDVIPAFQKFQGILGDSGTSVGGLIQTLSPLSIALSTIRGFMVGGFMGAWDAFRLRLVEIEDAIGKLTNIDGLRDFFDRFRTVLDMTGRSLELLIDNAVDFINKSDALEIVGSAVIGIFSAVGETIQHLGLLVRDNLGTLTDFGHEMGDLFTEEIGAASDDINVLIDSFSEFLQKSDAMPLAAEVVKNSGKIFGSTFEAINEGVHENLDTLSETVKDFGEKFNASLLRVSDAFPSIVDSISKIVEKSGIIRIVGDILAKAFDLASEAIQFFAKLIHDNIDTLAAIVKGFGDTVSSALTIAKEAFEALKGPIENIVTVLGPLAPLIGGVAASVAMLKSAQNGLNLLGLASGFSKAGEGAKELEKGAKGAEEGVEGVAEKAGGLGGTLGTFGTAIELLAGPYVAWQLANAATNGGLDKTRDQLLWLIDHQDEVKKVTGYAADALSAKVANSAGAPDVARALDNLPSFSHPLGKQVEILKGYTNEVDKAYASTHSFGALMDQLGTAFDLSTDALITTVGSFRDYSEQAALAHRRLLDVNDAGIKWNQTVEGPIPGMESVKRQANLLALQMNALASSYDAAEAANNAMSQQLSNTQMSMSAIDAGVGQLSLKVAGQTIAFKDQNLTMGDAYQKWKDLTAIQEAGGKGAYEAGVQAGQLKDSFVSLVGVGILPLLDAQYKNIATAGDLVTKQADVAAGTDATSLKQQEQIDVVSRNTDMLEINARKLRDHAIALGGTSKAAANLAGDVGNATTKIADYNKTDVKTKTIALTGLDAIKAGLDAALSAINTWNNTTVNTKQFSVGGGNQGYNPANGATPGVSAPAPSTGGGRTGGPNPSPKAFAQSLGGEFGIGNDLLGKLILQPAAKQVQQTSEDLGSLKNQIDAIIALFNSINSKALAAAATQAENASKIAGAASSMLDAFSKMKNYTSVSKEVMAQVSADVVAFTQDYINGAKGFAVKTLEGAATYIDTSGKVASAASSMVDLFGKLKDYKGPLRDSIAGFTGNVKDMVFDYVQYSKTFAVDSLAAASTYIETSGKIGSAASTMADALDKVRNWSGVAVESMVGFAYNVSIITTQFLVYAAQYNVGTLDAASTYIETTGKIGGAISSMADGLAKVRNWSGLARESISGFGGNVKDMVFDFSEYGKIFNDVSLKVATDFAEAAGKVTGIIGSAVTGLASLKDYAGLNRAAMSLFGSDMVEAVNDFASAGALFNKDGLAAATGFADAGGKVTGIISNAVAGFVALKDYKSVVTSALADFMGDVILAVQYFQAASEQFKPEAVTAAATFADGVKKIMDGLGGAITLFVSLKDFKGVAPKVLDMFMADVRLTVQKATQMAQEVGAELMPQITAFGVALSNVFKGLSDAITTFQGLEKYKNIAPAIIDDFLFEIKLTLTKTADMSDTVRIDILDKAKTFAIAVQDVFDHLKGAMETFKGLEEYKTSASDAIGTLLGDMVKALEKMAGMNSYAQTLYDQAAAFLKKMQDAASDIAAGMALAPGGGGGGGGTNKQGDVLPPLNGLLPMPGKALGGVINQSGVYNVGEFGPEKVWLPMGANVLTNGQAALQGSSPMAGASGAGGVGFSPIDQIASFLDSFIKLAKQYNNKAFDSVVTFAEGVGKIIATIKSTIDAMASLESYTDAGAKNIASVAANMVTLIQQFQNITGAINPKNVQKWVDTYGVFADGVGKIMTVMKSATDTLTGLARYVKVSAATIGDLASDMLLVVQQFVSVAAAINPKDVANWTATYDTFSEGVGSILTVIKSSVDTLGALRNYTRISATSITDMARNLVSLLNSFQDVINQINPANLKDWNKNVKAFSDTIGSVTSGLTNALTLLKGMVNYTALNSKDLTNFTKDLDALFLAVSNWGTTLPTQPVLDALVGKMNALGSIFANLKTMSAAISDTGEILQRQASISMVDSFMQVLKSTLIKMADLLALSVTYRDKALEFSKNVLAAAQSFQQAANSFSGSGVDQTAVFPTWLLTLMGSKSGLGMGGYALGGLVQKPGVYTVGEFGPEQVVLPGGSRVMTNQQTRGITLTGNVYLSVNPPPGADQATITRMVQVALKTAPDKLRANQIAGYTPGRGI